ncbi:MAG: radical SAM/SPASM domain-containing protein [Thermodesulfobacteriota bacterium]
MNAIQNLRRLATLWGDFSKRRAVCRGLPVRLWIETSSLCNLSCPMCVNRDLPPAEKRNMDMALFTRIIDQVRTFAHDVNLHHRGEPLINPDFPDMLRHAKRSGLAVRFHTNAVLMDRALAARILASGPDLVSISFDGFEKDAYEAIRRGACFETTVENIAGLLDERQKQRARTYIMVERIAFPGLDHAPPPVEARAFEKRLTCLGVDEIVTKQPFAWPAAGPARPGGSNRSCAFPWYAMVICADGTVTPCPQDGRSFMRMGDAGKQSLRDIWNGPAYQNLRMAMSQNAAGLPLCGGCDRLTRPQAAGLPVQYMVPFLLDMFAGYGPLRRRVGSFERNRRGKK